MRTFTSEDWIENFRMNWETFLYLCDQLKPLIQWQDTRLQKAICVQHRLAITLVPVNIRRVPNYRASVWFCKVHSVYKSP